MFLGERIEKARRAVSVRNRFEGSGAFARFSL
jgi:hypothetical protein